MIKDSTQNQKEEDFLTKVMDLNNKMNLLDEIMYNKFVELAKVKTELLYQTEENRLLMELYHGESEISIMKPKFTLKNIEYKIEEKNTACVLFRVKNLVYMTLVFEVEISKTTKDLADAIIEINMPMWKIYSGMFNVEHIYHCIKDEPGYIIGKNKKGKNKELNKICAKYEQKGNKLSIRINKDEFGAYAFWRANSKKAELTIKANFFIEPPLRRRLGKFYVYNVLSDQVILDKNNTLVLDNNWTNGSLMEIYDDNKEMKIRINNKYLNNADNNVILEKDKKLDNEIEFVPGFADIIQIILYIDKKPFFLTIEQNQLVLKDEFSGNNQFLIIPENKE